jgi:hypothetical protein
VTMLSLLLALTMPSAGESEAAREERMTIVADVITEVSTGIPWLEPALVATIVEESRGDLAVHEGRRRSSIGAVCLTQIAPTNPLSPWPLDDLVGTDREATFRCIHVAAVSLVHLREVCTKKRPNADWAAVMFGGYMTGRCIEQRGRARLFRAIESGAATVCSGIPTYQAPEGWRRAASPPQAPRRFARRFLRKPVGSWHRGAVWGYLVEQHCDGERGPHKGVSVFERARSEQRSER